LWHIPMRLMRPIRPFMNCPKNTSGLPAYIRSAVTRCERCASYAATTPKTPTSSFPSAADQSVLLASTPSSSALARLRAPASGRRQARDDFRFPLNHLGIRRVALGNQLLDDLDPALDLLICHRLDAAGMLQLHLPRHEQGA